MRSDQELELVLGLVQLPYVLQETNLQEILLFSFFQRHNLFKKYNNNPKKLFIKWKDLFAEQKWKGLETAGAPAEDSNTQHRGVSCPQSS